MIGYLPTVVTAGEPLELEPSIDPPTFRHPTGGLTEALSLAQSSGGPVALLLLDVPDDWASCCGDCLVRTNGRHDCTRRGGSVVTPFESVYRPAHTVRTGPA